MRLPRIAVAGLTSCSGCQLALLNCEAELPEVGARFAFPLFPFVSSAGPEEGHYDVALVEGAVSSPEDVDRLLTLRARTDTLVAFGTCAAWGGIAGVENAADRAGLVAAVYGEENVLRSFAPQPLRRFVTVDFTITGCPPEGKEILLLLGAVLRGTLPVFPRYPVCMECRMRENRCLLIEDDALCLGPLVQAGCNARCPATGVPCEGCRGPVAEANVASERDILEEKGFTPEDIDRRMRRFCRGWNDDVAP